MTALPFKPLIRAVAARKCATILAAARWCSTLRSKQYIPRRALLYVPASSEKMLKKVPQIKVCLLSAEFLQVLFEIKKKKENNFSLDAKGICFIVHNTKITVRLQN